MEIKFIAKEIPPSINKLYFTRQGRRILSTAGRSWKQRFIGNFGGSSSNELLNFCVKPYDKLSLEVVYYFPIGALHTKGYKEDGTGRAKSPYKKIDVDNLLKVTCDAIADVLGIDDRVFFKIGISKEESEIHSGFIATVYNDNRNGEEDEDK